MSLVLDYSSGMPQRRPRCVTLHLLGAYDESTGRRDVATKIVFSENEEILLDGIVAALRLHDTSMPRREFRALLADPERTLGVAVRTRTWMRVCRSNYGWLRAIAKLLVEGGDAPEAFVYFAVLE
jgi:hypothetical protein